MYIIEDEIEQIFSKNKAFCQLSESEKESLQENMVPVYFKKNETIFKQGAYSSNVVFIASGLVKQYIEDANERKLILRIILPNDFMGLNSIHSDSYYDSTLVALNDSLIYQIKTEEFIKVVEANPSFAREIFKWYSKYNSYLQDKYKRIFTKQMQGRMADIILELSEKNYNNENIFSYLSRKDIADLIGMSCETIIRILSDFKQNGIIKTEGKAIEINDKEVLNRLSLIG